MIDSYTEGVSWLCYHVKGILLSCIGSTCLLQGKGHCKPTQLFWLLTFVLWYNISIRVGLDSSNDNDIGPIYGAWELTEWFDKYANIASWNLNLTEQLWKI